MAVVDGVRSSTLFDEFDCDGFVGVPYIFPMRKKVSRGDGIMGKVSRTVSLFRCTSMTLNINHNRNKDKLKCDERRRHFELRRELHSLQTPRDVKNRSCRRMSSIGTG